MPFKSKAQRRKFAQLLVEGKISDEVYEEWNRSTGRKDLPDRLHPPEPGAQKAKKAGKTRTAKKARKARKTQQARKTQKARKAPQARKARKTQPAPNARKTPGASRRATARQPK